MIASKPIFCVCLKHAILLQYFVGESHSLSVQCVLMFVTLVIILWSCTLVHDDLYRLETSQKLEKNPLMVVSEQSERAEIFALLRQKHIYLVLLCASVQEDEVQIVPPPPPVSLVFCCVGDSFQFFSLLPCLLVNQTLRHWSTFYPWWL